MTAVVTDAMVDYIPAGPEPEPSATIYYSNVTGFGIDTDKSAGVEDIVRDLQGEHGISWTHAAAFIKLVEGCGCCSERLRMVLDRLFQIATPEKEKP